MDSVKKIQQQIEAFEKRRRELAAEADATKGDLEAAQSDLIQGKKGAKENATRLQAEHTTTEGAIRNLNDRLEGLRSDLEEAQAEADREEKLSRMAALAEEAIEAKKTYDAAFQELYRQYEAAYEVIIGAHATRSAAFKAYQKLFEQTDGALKAMKDRGVDVSVVMDERPDLPVQGPFVAVLVQALNNTEAARDNWEKRPVAA